MHNLDGMVTVEAGEHRQSFPGYVDNKGRLHVDNHLGPLTQTLESPGHIRLEQTVLSGRVELNHQGGKLSASYFSKTTGRQDVTVHEFGAGA